MTIRVQQTGFSLVELMIGLVIGLIAMLLIGQTMAVFEADKRTTTGGADAQTNGYSALLAMERDIREAGAGMVGPDSRLACEGVTFRQYSSTQESAVLSPPNGFLPPIRIVNGGSGGVAGGGDAIVVVRSNVGYGATLPSVLQSNWVAGGTNCVTQGSVQPKTTNDTTRGQGDLFLVVPATARRLSSDLATIPNTDPPCNLVQASAAPPAIGASATCTNADFPLELTVATSQPYNTGIALPTPPLGSDMVIAMGPSPYIRFGIDNNKLMLAEQMKYIQRGNTYLADESLMDDIVYLTAQYGIDNNCVSHAPAGCSGSPAAPASQSVDQYVAATGTTWADTTLKPADFVRIKAVRIAVVARNSQYNRDIVSPATITLWQKINAGDATAPVYTVPDQHYRYRVFETVVPLKNLIWGQL